ncbi:MAG: SH3 domain-containing protein [bacterium]|nr:SH3 domain-containing protein [bacterium]
MRFGLLVLRCATPCLYRRPSATLAALRLLDIVHYACVAASCQRRGLLADRGKDLRTAALVLLGVALGGAAFAQEQAEDPPAAALGAPAAFDLSTDARPRLAVTVGLPLYARPSVRAAIVKRVRSATEVEVLERRGGWAKVSYEERHVWLAFDNDDAGFRLEAPRLADERLAEARRCLRRDRLFDLGPFPLYTDVEDEAVLADLVQLGRQVPEAFVRRYGLSPEPAAAAVVLVAGEEDYLACRHALAVADAPSDGYLEEGLAVFPAGERQLKLLRARLIQHMAYLLVAQALGANLPDWLRDALAYDLAYGRVTKDGTFEAEHLRRKGIRSARFDGSGGLVVTEQLLAPRRALRRLLLAWDEPQRPTLEGMLELGSLRLLEGGRPEARALCGFMMRHLLAEAESVPAERLRAFLESVAQGGAADQAAFFTALGTTPEALEGAVEAWMRETARKLRVDLGAKIPTLPGPRPYPGD